MHIYIYIYICICNYIRDPDIFGTPVDPALGYTPPQTGCPSSWAGSPPLISKLCKLISSTCRDLECYPMLRNSASGPDIKLPG
jgi:hypothetical protein